jgi:MFS family permease
LAELAVALFVAGIGLGVANTMNNASIMEHVPATGRAAASALVNMVRALGTALGLAVTTVLISVLGGIHSESGPRSAVAALVIVPLAAAVVCAVLVPSRRTEV